MEAPAIDLGDTTRRPALPGTHEPAMPLPASLARGLRLPVLASPLFIVSGPELVIAQSLSGVIGAFPALNARPQPLLDAWLERIAAARAAHDAAHPDRPSAAFAVNQIVHRSNVRLAEDLESCVRHRVPLVITSLGCRTDVIEAVHGYGGRVFHDVISIEHARKALDRGVDGLIAVAHGAGGHAGRLSPFALVEEIRGFWDGPLVLSGAIATGRAVLAAEALGCDLAYVGSAFIATAEANADAGYKRMVVESSAADIVYSNLFTGVHGNYLRGSIERAGLDPENLPASDPSRMDFGAAKAWRDIWGAGQGIGAVRDVVPAAALVDRLAAEYAAAKARLAG